MSKQKTKAELEATNKSLAKEIEHYVTQIDQIRKELIQVHDHADRKYEGLIEQLSLALKDEFIGYEFNQFGTVNRDRLNALTVNGIFFKIGRLTLLAKEYEELKDRSLPLPKMRVYEMENRVENHHKDHRI